MTIEELRTRIDELTCELYAVQDSQKKKTINFMRQRYRLSEPFFAEFHGTGKCKIELSFVLPAAVGAPFRVRAVLDNKPIIDELCFLDDVEKALKFTAEVELAGKNHTIGVTFDNALTAERFILSVSADDVAKSDGIIHLDYASDGGECCYLALFEKTCSLYDAGFRLFESFSGVTNLMRVMYSRDQSDDPLLHLFYIDTDASLRVRLLGTATTHKIADDVEAFALAKTSRGMAVYFVSRGVLSCATVVYFNGYVSSTADCVDLNPYTVKSLHCDFASSLLFVGFNGGGKLYSFSAGLPHNLVELDELMVRRVSGCYFENSKIYLYYPHNERIKAFVYNIFTKAAFVEDVAEADAYLRISPNLSLLIKDGLFSPGS